jgi:hypothetical protein
LSASAHSEESDNDEIVQVMEDVPNASSACAPFESVRDGVKEFWCRPQAEREHRVNIDTPTPLDGLERAICWVYWHEAVRRFHV